MAAPPPVLTLAVEKGPREGEIRQCRAGAALRVGRVASGNDLAVRDAGASQRHLAIEFLPPPASRWAVSDLGSFNGTLLNGARLAPSVPTPLSHGDLISFGESTVLAVSIAPDLDPNPPGPRRSSRRAAAVVAVEEEKLPVATRRGTRKKAVEPPEAEKEGPDAAAVVEEGKPRVVTRRGRRKKAAAAEPPEPEEEEEATVVTRRGGQKNAAEPPEPDKAEEEKEEEEAVVVTRRGGRKKDAATVAPPPLPPKTRSGRGQGRVTRASARKPVHVEEEQEENEAAPPRELTGNLSSAMAAKGGEEEKGDKVAAGDGEVEGTAKALEDEVPVARRGRARRPPKGTTNAQCAASDNNGEEEKGSGEEEMDGKMEVVGRAGDLRDGEKVEERACSSLETMTLREWFERMEKYLPRMINEAADEMIETLQERHQRVDEYISTLRNSSDPS